MSDEDTTRSLVKTLGENFIQRRDVKAIQRDSGAWEPVRSPWTMQDFDDHLSGKKTFGHYMLDHEGYVKLLAFDIDLNKPKPDADPPYWPMVGTDDSDPEPCDARNVWLDPTDPRWRYLCINLRCVAEGIAFAARRTFHCPVAIADSGGKGLHVYVFTGPRQARTVRAAAKNMLHKVGIEPVRGDIFYAPRHWPDSQPSNVEIEVFPKQDSLEGKDLGNLMKLPLGVNRKTGNRSKFITCNTPYDHLTEMEPIAAMSGGGLT